MNDTDPQVNTLTRQGSDTDTDMGTDAAAAPEQAVLFHLEGETAVHAIHADPAPRKRVFDGCGESFPVSPIRRAYFTTSRQQFVPALKCLGKRAAIDAARIVNII